MVVKNKFFWKHLPTTSCTKGRSCIPRISVKKTKQKKETKNFDQKWITGGGGSDQKKNKNNDMTSKREKKRKQREEREEREERRETTHQTWQEFLKQEQQGLNLNNDSHEVHSLFDSDVNVCLYCHFVVLFYLPYYFYFLLFFVFVFVVY